MNSKAVLVDDGEIHRFFELTYANYIAIPRSVLQSMSLDWQEKFVFLLEGLYEQFGDYLPESYLVKPLNKEGKFIKDDLADYDRGRRRLKPL